MFVIKCGRFCILLTQNGSFFFNLLQNITLKRDDICKKIYRSNNKALQIVV